MFSDVKKIFRVLALAMSGKEYDYTQGAINKAVILLAIPMVLEMAMESLFAVVDIYFVSKISTEAISVVGLTEAIITLIYAVAFGFGLAVTAVIARRIGEKNSDAAAHTAVQIVYVTLILALLIGALGFLFAEDLLVLMGTSAQVAEEGRNYTMLMLGFSATILFLFILSAVFRGAGNAVIAMRALWLANGVNIVLDPCLIFGYGPFPELGLTGAAVATNIGRGAGGMYMFYHLLKGSERIQIQWQHLRISINIITNLIRVSLGGIGQMFIATASWVFLMRIVSESGAAAVAGYTIAIRIVIFTMLPAWGLSNAAATLVGQSLGAQNSERAVASVWLTLRYTVVYMLLSACIFLIFKVELLSFFNDDEEIVRVGTLALTVFSLGYVFFGMGMVLIQALNGAGDTATPTWINFLCFWLFQIPFAMFAAQFLQWGPIGVFTSVALADTLIFLLALWQFQLGRWKLRQV